MSVAPDQLGEIYRKIRECFISHPVISVDPTKGDLPDQYEITYDLNVMRKTDSGEIVASAGHTIELTIPFGFPHFPPSCKPKSDIYHPDFDPAAICLGDFWNQDQALTDLIIHLGQMINGEIYSTTNAFNEEAAAWYLDNSSKLPLASIDWGTNKGNDSPLDDSPLDVSGSDIDTLDDGDLTLDFNFQAMTGESAEEKIILNTAFPEADEAPDVDLELLYLLQSQRKFYTLLEKTTEASASSKKASTLSQMARVEIKRAKELHAEGRNFENQGNTKESLDRYQQVAAAITDFPAIGSDIKRITQTSALLENMDLDQFQKMDESPPTKTDDDFAVPPKATVQSSKATLQSRKNAFSNNKGMRSKIPLYLLFTVLGSAVIYGGYLWYSFNHNLRKAEETLFLCSQDLENDQFDSAKNSCDKALLSLHKVKFVQQNKVRELQISIGKILQSEKLTQGLAGKILFEGKYLPKEEVQIVQTTRILLNNAEALYLKGKWQSAIEVYQKLLLQSEKTGHLSQKVIEDVKHKHLVSEFKLSHDLAQVPMQKGLWQEAAEKLIKAQRILETMPKTDQEQYSQQLQYAIQKCRFEDFKNQGDLFFSKSDWPNAISGYTIALSSAGDRAPLPPETIATVKKNIKRAELYSTINKGNEAYSSGAWDAAIEAFNKASIFLTKNKNILSQADAETNQVKLLRIILQASIIRDRRAAKLQLENKELTDARKSYQQILKHITKSPLATEEEFAGTKDEITSALKSLDEEIFFAEKIDYLESRYKSLFLNIYPDYLPENLSHPTIVYTKEIGSKLVFRIQCTEKRGGSRPSTLRIHYAFDQKTSRWSQFSEN